MKEVEKKQEQVKKKRHPGPVIKKPGFFLFLPCPKPGASWRNSG
jgi:hypothetical protein